MATRFPGEPFSPDRLPDPEPAAEGVDPVFSAIYRAAVSGADAYRATRTAVRQAGEILRIGNRFIRAAQYREVAFVALGRAAVSQALAVSAALGESLTQGLVAGPDPLPSEVPFRHRQVATDWPGGAGREVVDQVLELAAGLNERDLFLVLLSAGSLGFLARPPETVSPAEWRRWLEGTSRAGADSREVARLARLTGGGAIGGRLVAATRADVVTLVVDRGDGADLVGGGPTSPVSEAEMRHGRELLEKLRSSERAGLPEPPPFAVLPLSGPGGTSRDARPVAITSPADALRDAAEAVSEKRWAPRLAKLTLNSAPEAAADEFLARGEAILAEEREPKVATTGPRRARGVVAFATTTLGLLEGVDERTSMERFLSRAAGRLPRREAMVGLLRTSGGDGAAPAPGGVIGASRGNRALAPGSVRPMRMRAGITDVGFVVALVVPTS